MSLSSDPPEGLLRLGENIDFDRFYVKIRAT
jgi:hypothetical protein